MIEDLFHKEAVELQALRLKKKEDRAGKSNNSVHLFEGV